MRTAISFIIIFNIMVFVHEFGHYFFARRNGIKVHEFALGMGPAILKKQVGDTLYALRALPIGGFVKMEGEDDESNDPESFSNKSPWQRFQVIVAGSVNNILLAFLALFLVPVLSGNGVITTTIDAVVPDSPAYHAGIEAGDKLYSIDGQKINIYFESSMAIEQAEGPTEFVVTRNGEQKTLTMTPAFDEAEQRKIVGINYGIRQDVLSIASFTLKQMSFFLKAVVGFLVNAIRGQASMDEVAGPVGLVTIVGETAKFGWLNLLNLLGVLSLNLGIINLLPIPALDGGRLLFIIIELLRGKPVSKEKEAWVHMIGMVLLLLLIGFVTFNDIAKLF